MPKIDETYLTSPDGVRLFVRSWLPDATPKSVLAFTHGQSDHVGRFVHVGLRLSDAGHALFMVDLRGHGQSAGKRGHVASFDDYISDFAALRTYARNQLPDARHFFGGHSMGGLIALRTAVDNPDGYAGVAVSSPWLRLAFAPPSWKVQLGKVASGLIPAIALDNELDSAYLARPEPVGAAYEADPLVHGLISAGAFNAITNAQQETFAQAHRIQLPVLITHGSADHIADISASKEIYAAIQSSDKTLHIYPGMYHEPFNESENEQVFEDWINWLDLHS